MIPKMLHQIWVGPSPKPVLLMQTWPDAHPGWRYQLWTSEEGWECQDKIDAMPEWNGKADIMRYEILAREGGICVDADSECVRPLDDSFLAHDSFACFESELARPGLIATGYLGATAGNRLMRECVDRIKRCPLDAHAWVCVGPQFFTEVARGYEALHVYPSRTFIPRHYTGVAAPGDCPVHAVQYWGSTFGYDRLPATSAGRWDWYYEGAEMPGSYGDDTTYRLGAEFLRGLALEDWGCGLGWMRRFVDGPYVGVDGSRTPFTDKVRDLCEYKSLTPALFMRHVIEHNQLWRLVLRNAIASFTKRMVLVVFTPFQPQTVVLCEVEAAPGIRIPEIGFARADLVQYLDPYLVREQTVLTNTRYGTEHVFYLEKQGLPTPQLTTADEPEC